MSHTVPGRSCTCGQHWSWAAVRCLDGCGTDPTTWRGTILKKIAEQQALREQLIQLTKERMQEGLLINHCNKACTNTNASLKATLEIMKQVSTKSGDFSK